MLIKEVENGDGTALKSLESTEETLQPQDREIVCDSQVNPQILAVKVLVGASARVLFYPTLFYNVVRNKLESEFRWWDQIEQFILLGAVPFPTDVLRLKELGVKAVVTLNESYETLVSTSQYESQMIKHLVIPTRDYLFAPCFEDIQRAVDFIHENVQQEKSTYVHCKAGRGRSTTIVICYLVKYRGMSPFEAFQYIRSKRPRVLLAASQWKAVLKFSEYQSIRSSANLVPVSSLLQQWPDDTEDKQGHLADTCYCGELPILVTLSDLEGYTEAEALGQHNLGIVYKVGIVTAKSVIGVAKASATLARLSYIWLGYQSRNQGFNMTVTCSSISNSDSAPSVAPQPLVSVQVCQRGLVEC